MAVDGGVTPALGVIARPRDGTILEAEWNLETESWPSFIARVDAQVQAEGYRGFRVCLPQELLTRMRAFVAKIQAEPVAPLAGDVSVESVVLELATRIAKALDYAVSVVGIDGAHHKQWGIDQMVRALTGCPMVEATAIGASQQPYTYECQGESDEYKKLVADACAGEDGAETYSWDTGIAP